VKPRRHGGHGGRLRRNCQKTTRAQVDSSRPGPRSLRPRLPRQASRPAGFVDPTSLGLSFSVLSVPSWWLPSPASKVVGGRRQLKTEHFKLKTAKAHPWHIDAWLNNSRGGKMGYGANLATSVSAGEKRPEGSTVENRGVVEQLAHMAGRSVEQLVQPGRLGRPPVRATARSPMARFRWSLGGMEKSRRLGFVVCVAKKGSLEVGHEISTIGGTTRKTGSARFVPSGRQECLPSGWTWKGRPRFQLSALVLVIGAWALVIPAQRVLSSAFSFPAGPTFGGCWLRLRVRLPRARR